MRSVNAAGRFGRSITVTGAAVIVANGLRLRHRLTSLSVLADRPDAAGAGDSGSAPAGRAQNLDGAQAGRACDLDGAEAARASGLAGGDDHLVVHVAGGGLRAATLAAAVAHLRAHDLEAVDLVPGDLPVEELLDHLRISDPARLRANPIFLAFGAGQAVVMTRRLAERAGVTGGAADTVDVRRAFAQAKRYAPHAVDQAVAPGLAAVPLTVDENLAVWRTQYGRPLPMIAATRLGPAAAAVAAAAAGARVGRVAPVAAAAALQPTIVTAGTAVRPRDRGAPGASAARIVGTPLRLARSARGRWRPARPAHTDPQFIEEERRRAYADDLARGVERFFGPERDDCPICGGTETRMRIEAADMIQCKPGTFRVDTCATCGSSFQNPQLTLEGLEFYYRDFYDGSGSADTEMMFSADWPLYQRRARLINGFARPRRWLDVGGGHGHFCLVASSEHPEARFELLDQPSAVAEARRRGWVADGHGDMFPKAAQALEASFDVVSMFHYLEHTTDPLAELDAAHRVLEPGGHLIVEVPAPDCRPACWYGWAWGPWMQPQHLNLLPLDTMVDQLERRGFEILHTDRRRPRQPWDTSWAAFQVLTRLAPGPNAPWTPARSRGHRAARLVALAAGTPLMVAAVLADRLVIGPLIRIDPKLSNVYWVVARKPG